MNDFDKLTYEQQHAKEIQSSRFGWFGGSDAKMLLDVYLKRRTFATMSNTQRLRFNLLMGWRTRYGEFDTPCIRSGHYFEDYMQDKITGLQNAQGIDGTLEREKCLRGEIYQYFGTMAHADYTIGSSVFELKYIYNTPTQKVAQRYECQLQWYYMLGADAVVLVHGEGCAEPFQCFRVHEWYIARDDGMIAALRDACAWADYVIDEAVRMCQNTQDIC